jgi:hypothetical protein
MPHGRSAVASGFRSFQFAKSRLWRIRWTMQVCRVVSGNTAASASLIPLSPSVTAMRMSWQPRVFRSVKTFIQNFAPSVCSIQMPRMSRLPSGRTGEGEIHRQLPAQRPRNQRFLEAPRRGLDFFGGQRAVPDDLIEDFSRDRRQNLGWPLLRFWFAGHTVSSCYASHTKFRTPSRDYSIRNSPIQPPDYPIADSPIVRLPDSPIINYR